MIEQGLKKLRQRYSDHIIEIIRLMLKFDESERPSFIELGKLVLTSTENTIDSPKAGMSHKPSNQSASIAKHGPHQKQQVFSQQNLTDAAEMVAEDHTALKKNGKESRNSAVKVELSTGGLKEQQDSSMNLKT